MKIAFVLAFSLIFLYSAFCYCLATENLLLNPNFENGLTGWEKRYPSTVTVAIEETIRHTGAKSLRVIKGSSKGWGYAYQDVRVEGGNYKLSGWVRWADEKIASVKLRLELFDAAGKKIGSPREVAAPARKAEWQFLELAAEVGEEARTARIECFVNQDEPNPLKPALFDDLEFMLEGEEPEPPPEPPAWPTKISLSEFMPDPPNPPAGGGKEWVEIFNGGDSMARLDDWQIDDIEGGGSPVSFSVSLAAHHYYKIEINKSLLNNAGDSVRLLRSDDFVVETVSYSSSQKGVSWAKNDQGTWQQTTTPTPGAANKISLPPAAGGPAEDTIVPDKITLSEFYPYPQTGETEWVEIFNHNSSAVELEDWQIDDQEGGSGPKTFSAHLEARSYYLFDLKTRSMLNNGGDEVRLLKPNGTVADAFAYKKAVKSVAWARDAQGEWQLTTTPTPGGVNQITKLAEKTEAEEQGADADGASTARCPQCPSSPQCPTCPVLAAATTAAASSCPPATASAIPKDEQGEITPQAWSDDKSELIAAQAKVDRLAAQKAQLEEELYLWKLKTVIGGVVGFCLLLIAFIYFKFGW